MHIIEMELQNYKKISAITLELNGGNLRVVGKAGQGKTTAVSALWEVVELAADPIQRGKNAAKISLVLGDPVTGKRVEVERKYTAKGSTLVVKAADGQKITAKEFREWFSGLSINPHKILDMKPLEAVRTLLEAAELPEGVDLAAIDLALAKAEADRLEAGRTADTLEKIAARPAGEPVAAVSTVALAQELAAVNQKNQTVAGIREDLGRFVQQEAELAAQLEELRGKIARGKEWLEQNREQPTGELEQQLQAAEEINRAAAAWTAYQEAERRAIAARDHHTELDQTVKNLQLHKKETLEKARWPLPGVSVENGSIHFHGIPLEQCGTSQQLLVCGAIAASSISRKELRVVRMDGVESMDPADLEQLVAIFNRAGVQVLTTRVSRGDIDPGEITIEDGAVVTE